MNPLVSSDAGGEYTGAESDDDEDFYIPLHLRLKKVLMTNQREKMKKFQLSLHDLEDKYNPDVDSLKKSVRWDCCRRSFHEAYSVK